MAIVGSAEIVVRAITTGFKKDVEDSLRSVNGSVKSMGEKTGQDFSNSVSKGMKGGGKGPFDAFAKEAEKARERFNSLTRASYALGPAISGAVSAVSDLVFGLFAVGSAAGAAAPALAVLPSMLIAIGQAGAVAKLAFMGVGKAISALSKQSTGGGGGGAAQAAARDKAIADARKALARAYQSAADQMAAADQRVLRAQVDLNNAYKKGAESLQQLGFDAEDAAISQGKAAIELERAKETLARVQDLPPNSRARRDAELAFKEADLNYRQAVDRSNDLAEAQKYAKETGIEGTQEVLDAKQNLADAEADRAKTERDNAQSIADAQENVAEALKKTTSAGAAASDALAGLPKSAQEFAKFIVGLKPEFDKLRAAAADGLFPGLTSAIQNLVDNLFPHLIPIIGDTATAIGTFADKFSTMLTTPENLEIIDQVFGKDNVDIIKNMGDVSVSLGDALLKIMGAVSPIAVDFSAWLKTIADNFDKYIAFKDGTGELSTFFQNAVQPAKDIGTAIADFFKAIFEVGKGASDAGLRIVDAFDGAMVKLRDWAKEANSTGELNDKFNDIADNVIAIGGFLGEVVKALFELSGNKGVKEFFDTIKPVPGIFADVAKNLTDLGPTLGEFVVSFATLIAKFADSKGPETFFKILTKALDILNVIFDNDAVMKVVTFLSIVKGVSLALGTIGTVGGFAFKVLGGNILFANGLLGAGPAGLAGKLTNVAVGMEKINKGGGGAGLVTKVKEIGRGFGLVAEQAGIMLKKLPGAKIVMKGFSVGLRVLGAAFRFATGPIGLIILAITALVAIFVYAYKHNEKFREIVDKVWAAIKAAIGAAVDAIIGIFHSLIDFGMKLWNFLTEALEPVIEAVKAIFNAYIGFWRAIIETIIGIGLVIWNFLSEKLLEIWGIVKGYWTNTVMPFFTGIVDAVKAVASKVWNFISDGLSAAWGVVKGYWDNTVMPFVNNIVTKVSGVAGKVWDFISDGISNAWGKVTKFFKDNILPYIEGLKDKISSAASGMWNGLKSGLETIVNTVIKGLNAIIDGINILIRAANKVKIGKDIDEVKHINPINLAKGGIVPSTYGGTLARIGEAGRPERVEPLDPQGLSVRDRAIIAELSAKQGGNGENITFNIYPSQGMNELDLANMVSRKVAWTLKRGAA